jgi:hypothetical protein
VLREVLGPPNEKTTAGWYELLAGELYNLYYSPNDITVIRSGRMSWSGVVTHRGGEKINNILMEKLIANINWEM